MIDKVVSEMKSKPFTMIMILGLYAVVTVMWRSTSNYANAGELKELKAEVGDIKQEIKKSSIEQQLRNVRSELFSLQQTVAELNAGRKPVPADYNSRINVLKNDENTLAIKLSAIYAAEAQKAASK